MMSMLASAASRLCMTITGTPRAATSGAICGIALQAPDIVDDCRALVERPGGDLALMVSIDTGRPSLTTAGRTGASRANSSSAETGLAPP